MTSPPGHLWSGELTWHHFLSRYCHLLELHPYWRSNFYSHFLVTSTATSWWLLVKWRLVRVISGHVRSRDVIFRNMTATSCELQPCRSSNVPKTRLIGLLQPLPGDIRSNNVPSGLLPVTWCDFLSRDCHLRATAL